MKTLSVRRSARAGFTLTEVLLTLMIMGGILLSMTKILTAARTSRDTIHNIQEARLAGPAIMDRIERDIRGLLVYNIPRETHIRVSNRVMLGMDGDSIDFVTTTDSLSPHPEFDRYIRTDINEVGYCLRPSEVDDDFLEIYRREDAGIDDEPFRGGTYTFLHDRVKAFDIQAFEEDGEDAEPIDEWGEDASKEEHQRGLPTRIEISLTLELAPRITNERISVVPLSRRTIVYKRIIRMPESLRLSLAAMPAPIVPVPATGGEGEEEEGAAGGGSTTDPNALDQPQNLDPITGDGEAGDGTTPFDNQDG